jgi:glycosyltransferase involved in cell wall biosynthesis
MKVIFDISVLGTGHMIERGRTGIFRVIENVAAQLPLIPECEVIFCSNRDRGTVDYSLAYLKATKGMSDLAFSKPPLYDSLLQVARRKDELIKQMVTNVPRSPLKKLGVKLKIRQLIAVERLFRLYSDDLIHPRDIRQAEIYHSPFFPLPAKYQKKGLKSFITCYDLIPILFPQYFEQDIIELMKRILKSINHETWVLCISASTRNDVLNYLGHRVNPERVIVTELAASDTFYQSRDKEKNLEIRRKHHIPDGPYILSLCTLEPRKNIDQVIRAFALLIAQENIPDLNLVLVGNKGWLFDKIFEEIENSAAVKNRIIITGFVPDEDLAAIYSDAMFFVYPSFYEGFGLPPLEAMKCGTPVITSNTSSLPEVVGDAGIMIAPADLDALCHAMLSVYSSPGLQRNLGIRALERATQFSWERCGRQTVDAYKASLSV